jgi:hypothetical protein
MGFQSLLYEDLVEMYKAGAPAAGEPRVKIEMHLVISNTK